ncbi:MAG: DUF599 family protein [Alphaproteobacteria bacterium]|jgi:uncharacterized membrane protein|nr:DUF599 family protein [Alphaproteobacteria bacterium]
MPMDWTVFPWPDWAALAWFLACWIGYTVTADHSPLRRRSIAAAMAVHRRRWMREMLGRDLRIVDTQILGNLVTGIGFFASTSILMIGGLFAVMGAADRAIEALGHLPFAAPPTRPQWTLKVLLLLAVFVYAFFKFAWSFRLANYTSILVGAAPHKPESDTAADAEAARLASLSILVNFHFNRGIRAFFFALAALGWFVHPVLFAAAAVFVVAVLYRREFRSEALRVLR